MRKIAKRKKLSRWSELHGSAMLDIIYIVGLVLVACIAWVVWIERKSKLALEKDALDQAWREMPNDPQYAERRHFEERKRIVDQARADAAGR